jgi:O-methyltransferase
MAMTAKARLQIASITAACDFSACELIADIGGGLGHLLQATLDAAPRAAGVLFDLPPVIEHAAAAASGRLSLQPGDFFTDPLPAAGTYLIMDVIHDWDDDQTVTLLSSAPAASTSSCWTRPDPAGTGHPDHGRRVDPRSGPRLTWPAVLGAGHPCQPRRRPADTPSIAPRHQAR